MKPMVCGALVVAIAAAAAPVAAQNGYDYPDYRSRQDRQASDEAWRDYQRAIDDYNRDRDAFERRYGPGSADRYYGPPTPPPNAQAPYGGGYGGGYGPDPYGPGYNPYRGNVCESRSGSGDRTAGTVIGALIGGALGAAVAGDDSQTEGAVLGAVVGGTFGYNLAGSTDTADRYAARCDADGYYFTYDQTFPYREGRRGSRRNGRFDDSYYVRLGCRLAVAPWSDDRDRQMQYRYVRVCPDRANRYRITS